MGFLNWGKTKFLRSLFDADYQVLKSLPVNTQLVIYQKIRREYSEIDSLMKGGHGDQYLRAEIVSRSNQAKSMRHLALEKGASGKDHPQWMIAAICEHLFNVLLAGDTDATAHIHGHIRAWMHVMELVINERANKDSNSVGKSPTPKTEKPNHKRREVTSGSSYEQSANIREKTDRAVHGRAESAKSGSTYKHADDKPKTKATTAATAPAIQPTTHINTSTVVVIIFFVLLFAGFFFSSKKSAESPAVNNSSNASGSASVVCANIDSCLKETMNAISKNDVAMVRAIAAKIETFANPLRGNSNYARQLNAEGLLAFEQDDFAQAATVFAKANREDPSDAEIAGNLGTARVKAGDFVGGSRALMEALQLSPRRVSTWIPIAELYALYHQNTNDASAALLVAYEWSNKEAAIKSYSLQAEIETHPLFKAAYKQALQVISPGFQQFQTDKEPTEVPELTAVHREDKFWHDANAAGNKSGYDAYLERYPDGRFASTAKANIARLSPAPPVALPPLRTTPSDVPGPNRDGRITGEEANRRHEAYMECLRSSRYGNLGMTDCSR